MARRREGARDWSPALSRRAFLQASSAAAVGTLIPASALAWQSASIATTDLGGITLLQGAGCNVLALPGPDGALMIDGGLAVNAGALLAAVMQATGATKIHTLVNTHGHPEQVGANDAVGKAGGVIFAHENTRLYLSNTVDSITFTGRRAPLPKTAWPTKTVRAEGSMQFGGQQIDYGYLPAAHTDGDLYVQFPTLNLLVAGGVLAADHWPVVDHRNGAWLGGRVRAMERLAKLVTPNTRVVPAHGPVTTGMEVIRQRDIYVKLFATMIEYLNKGYGPEDAAKANPLKEYSAQFGDATAFTYGALRSMMIAYVPD